MRYLEIDTGSPVEERQLPWWCKVLKFIFPAANPDLESYFDQVQFWWLEINDDGEPQREIGFNPDGTAIVLGPVHGNFGYLIDASDDWSDEISDSTKARERFDAEWNALWPKFEEIDKRNSHT